jgi:hypothetical protein
MNIRHFSAALVTVFAMQAADAATAKLTEADKAAVKVNITQNTAYEFTITVDLNKQRYRFASYIPDFESPTDGLALQRKLMGWKGNYLFVRHQCGQVADWRCVVDQIFTRAGNKLVHLGMVESRDCRELGCRYDLATDTFADIYDKYQVSPITGQNDTPPIAIVRRVKGESLATDLNATWQQNLPRYEAGLACLNQVSEKGFAEPCAKGQSPWSALSYIAKLTHYTGRTAERESLFTNQAVAYCKQSADTRCEWRMNGAKDFFARFDVGAAPIYVPSPVTLTSTTEDNKKALMPQKLDSGRAIKLKL